MDCRFTDWQRTTNQAPGFGTAGMPAALFRMAKLSLTDNQDPTLLAECLARVCNGYRQHCHAQPLRVDGRLELLRALRSYGR